MKAGSVTSAILAGLISILFAVNGFAQVSAQAATGMVQDTEWNGVKAQLISVKRAPGNTLTISFKYTNSSNEKVEIWKVGRIEHDNLLEHLYHIDVKNNKKYLVVRDSAKKAIGSQLFYLELAPGETKSGWGKYPAPAADITKVSVYLPGAPPFEEVAIQ